MPPRRAARSNGESAGCDGTGCLPWLNELDTLLAGNTAGAPPLFLWSSTFDVDAAPADGWHLMALDDLQMLYDTVLRGRNSIFASVSLVVGMQQPDGKLAHVRAFRVDVP